MIRDALNLLRIAYQDVGVRGWFVDSSLVKSEQPDSIEIRLGIWILSRNDVPTRFCSVASAMLLDSSIAKWLKGGCSGRPVPRLA